MIASSLLFPFRKCIGIEYLEQLNNIGLNIFNKTANKFDYKIKNSELFPLHVDESNNFIIPEIFLVHGDFLKVDWSDGDVIFANSTCYTNELMYALSKKAQELNPGAIVITFTKRLPNLQSNRWELKDGFRRLMSWGIATVYFHKKIA